MAVAFRAASSAAATTQTSIASTSLPAGTVNGDTLVLSVRLDGTALAVNTPSGWTQIVQGSQATDGWTQAIFWRISNGTAPSISWDGTSHISGWYMTGYSGTDATAPINAASAQLLTDGFDTTWVAGSGAGVTTTVDNCLIVALGINVNGFLTNALGGWTEEIDSSGYFAAEAPGGTAGAFAKPTFTLATAARENAELIAIQPPNVVASGTQTESISMII